MSRARSEGPFKEIPHVHSRLMPEFLSHGDYTPAYIYLIIWNNV